MCGAALQAAFELACRLFGERDEQDFLQRDALQEQAQRVLHNRVRFAGAGGGLDDGVSGQVDEHGCLYLLALLPNKARCSGRKRLRTLANAS